MDINLVVEALTGAGLVPIHLESGVIQLCEATSADRAEIRAATKRPLPIQIAKKTMKIIELAGELQQLLSQANVNGEVYQPAAERVSIAQPGLGGTNIVSRGGSLAMVPFVQTVPKSAQSRGKFHAAARFRAVE